MTRKMMRLLSLLAALLLLTTGLASATEAIGELVKMTGRVDILRGGKLPSEKGVVGAKLFIGDFIRTKSKASAEVLFTDGNRIRVEPRSRVDISSYSAAEDKRSLSLNRGKVEAIVIPGSKGDDSERPKRFEIQTPNAVAGVRGTTIVVAFQDNVTAIHVKKASSGRSVYSISRSFPGRIVNVPVGGMMWVRNDGPPTLMPPGSDPRFTSLMLALNTLGDLGDLGLLADAASTSSLVVPTTFTDTFPQALGVQVGTVNMFGSTSFNGYTFSVNMDTNFYAIDTKSAPFYWEAPSVAGAWNNAVGGPAFDPTGQVVFISGGTAGEFAAASFSVSSWSSTTGNWTANVDSGSGDVPNGSTFDFSGSASGFGATGALSGSIAGTASGTAADNSGGN